MDPSSAELMSRALRLAALGRGMVEPNPMVGCVLARQGRIIGEGYHRRFGGPHAEREALAAATAPPAGATAYVTLEPCCHTNKKTPPCVPALIEARIARVVIACADPNPCVCGRGAEQLRAAGIGVEVGLLEAEARQLNAAFFARAVHHRPYITLKWAQTADGKVAGAGGKRLAISNAASLALVHRLRARSDAILVGINTVLADDPMLTARNVESARPLLRAVLDSRLRMPMQSRLVQSAGGGPVLVYCREGADRQRMAELAAAGVMVVPLPADAEGHPAFEAVLADLYARQVMHLMVEPGPALARSLMGHNWVDRVWVFQSPRAIDAPDAPAAAGVEYPVSAEVELEGDGLREMLNPSSPVFFCQAPSPDLPI